MLRPACPPRLSNLLSVFLLRVSSLSLFMRAYGCPFVRLLFVTRTPRIFSLFSSGLAAPEVWKKAPPFEVIFFLFPRDSFSPIGSLCEEVFWEVWRRNYRCLPLLWVVDGSLILHCRHIPSSPFACPFPGKEMLTYFRSPSLRVCLAVFPFGEGSSPNSPPFFLSSFSSKAAPPSCPP